MTIRLLASVALAAALFLPLTRPVWAIEYVTQLSEPGTPGGKRPPSIPTQSGQQGSNLLGVPYLGGVRGVTKLEEPGGIPNGQLENSNYLSQQSIWQSQGNRPTNIQFVPRNVARQAAQHGFLVTGTSGKTAEGYVEYIQWQPARLGAGSASGNGHNLTGVELGQESGWVRLDPQQARNMWETSNQRALNILRDIQQVNDRAIALGAQYYATQDPNQRAQILAAMQQTTAALQNLGEMRNAEVELQRTLRP